MSSNGPADMTKVLHLCSYYLDTRVYMNLFAQLDSNKIEQAIKIFVRKASNTAIDMTELAHGQLRFDKTWSFYHDCCIRIKLG